MESKELWFALWKMNRDLDNTGERMPWDDAVYDAYKELRTDLDNLSQEIETFRAELRKHNHLEGKVVIPL